MPPNPASPRRPRFPQAVTPPQQIQTPIPRDDEMTHSHVHPIEVGGEIAGLAVGRLLDYLWAAVDRLSDGSMDFPARGPQIGRIFRAISPRSQLAF